MSLDHCEIRHHICHRLQLPLPDFGVGHLASLELARDLDLVPFLEKTTRVLQEMRNIVFRDSRTDLYTLNFLLFALVFLLFSVLVVLEFAVIDDPADRRIGSGGDQNQVETLLLGHAERLPGTHDANLFAVGRDEANFAEPQDSLIDHRRGARPSLAPEMWPPYRCSPRLYSFFFCIRSTVYLVGAVIPNSRVATLRRF